MTNDDAPAKTAYSDLLGMRDYATDRQWELALAVVEHGSIHAAAAALSLSPGTVGCSTKRLRAKAAQADAGLEPMDDASMVEIERRIPPGASLKGTSLYTTLPNGDRVWVKSDSAKADPRQMMELLKQAVAGWEGPCTRVAEPDVSGDSDLLTVYPMGDPHFGCLSWAPETGADFDVGIAERNLTTAMRQLVSVAPPSAMAVVSNQGDFFHGNDQSGTTPGSGHRLDTDSRHVKVLQAGLRAMITCVKLALAKHETVRVINMRGNHDPDAAFMLVLGLDAYFTHEPRVQVMIDPAPFQHMVFGRNLLAWAHGHGVKPNDLPSVMASEWPKAWGCTRYRQWLIGHFHHELRKEHRGCVVEIIPTLAPGDAWHRQQGYMSDRSMSCQVFHRDRGPLLRHTVGIEQVEAGV